MFALHDSGHGLTLLAKRLKGSLRTDSEAIAEASLDFGGVVLGRPHGVVQPADVSDVVALVRFAREMNWMVTVRGAGHSQGGQALNHGGIILDTRNLNGIEALNKEEGWVIVGAGALWGALLRTVLEVGLLPPVLTDHLAVTIGGTLSVGGVGPASFRNGLQARHCLGVEVVLGTGEVVWLTPESEPELFQHVLGGLGRLGIITKAKLCLRSFRRYFHSVYLTYQNLETFLNDALILMKRDQVHFLEGFAHAKVDSTSQARKRQHRYFLEITTEVDELTAINDRQLLQDLKGESYQPAINRKIGDFVFRLEETFANYKRPTEANHAHPWVEHFMPFPAVDSYVNTVASLFPATSLLLWPMQTEFLHLPLCVMPETPEVVLVGIMASLPHSHLQEALPLLEAASRLGITLGGKRYLSGWINFDREQWHQHYGPLRWERLVKLKQQCDPDQVLPALPYL